MSQSPISLPPLETILDEIESVIVGKGWTIHEFIRVQRLAASTWYRWRNPDKKSRMCPRYDMLRDLLAAANRMAIKKNQSATPKQGADYAKR